MQTGTQDREADAGLQKAAASKHEIGGFYVQEDARLLSSEWEFSLEAKYPTLVVETSSAIRSAVGSLDGIPFRKSAPGPTLTILGRGSALVGRARGAGFHQILILTLSPGVRERFPEYPIVDVRACSNLWNERLHRAGLLVAGAMRSDDALATECACCALTAELLRGYGIYRAAHLRESVRLTPVQVKTVIEYIVANLSGETTISAMAALCSLSDHHFISAFRTTLGITPHQFVLRKRILHAMELLAKTQLPIRDIATSVGFANQSHFTARFRAAVGATPLRFRARI